MMVQLGSRLVHRSEAPARTVMITGDLQILGRSLATRLAGRTNVRTIGQPERSAGGDVSVIAGSMAAPQFGLSPAAYRELAGQVDAVVHLSSASTFAASGAYEVLRTRRVLNFVEAADAPLYWVSSAFVNTGGPSGRHRQTGWLADDSRLMVQSLIQTSAPEHVAIRSSMVIGDSRTGAIAAFPGIYRVLAAMLQHGHLAAMPVDLNWRLDLMPCDVVADITARLIEHRVTDREVWVTMGEQALRIEQVFGLLQTFAAEPGRDLSPSAFPLVGPQMRRYESFLQALSPGQRRVVAGLVDLFVDQLVHREPLESSLGDGFANSLGELGALGIEPLPDPGATLLASLQYWRSRQNEQQDIKQAAVA